MYTPLYTTKCIKYVHPGDKYIPVIAFLSIGICVILGTESEIQLYHLGKLERSEEKKTLRLFSKTPALFT